ncbi:MAG: DUF4954 family protein [Prevotella sp.]|nr:DUF4954 family protein [Prevotella sp.]
MNDNYRSLTLDEITTLENNGCTAEDWNTVYVAEDFTPDHIRRVAFYGEVSLGVFDKHIEVEEGFSRHSGLSNATLRNVTVGDNCLIENIGNHISGYTIGEECYISNVGVMTTVDGATYGCGNIISVMNEAGDGNVILYDGLTSQMAAFMVEAADDKELWTALKDMIKRHVDSRRPAQGTVGYRVKIVNSREIVNVCVSDDCEINCASRLVDCTLAGSIDSGVYIGNDVICENTIVSAGASVLNGAKVDNCFVGEACHIGKGFSAESSVFFANSYMDNGEACAAFCGPFTVSHHKSTLLIGARLSFYNAGSGTNYSNHAYKIGPVHYGTLERGSKTASGAHILMPATIGAFSMCMGKISNHPDTSCLPFSYVIASGDNTFVVPGCNLATVGTYRDTAKWPKRDMRPHADKRSIVNFDWLNPYTIRSMAAGKRMLEKLRSEQGDDAAEYSYGGCTIRHGSLVKGMMLYDMALKMYFSEVVKDSSCCLPSGTEGTGEWTDLAGLLAPKSEKDRLADDIKAGTVDSVGKTEARFIEMHARYADYRWNMTYGLLLDYYDIETLTADDTERIIAEGDTARKAWLAAIARDAEKEAALGDVSDSVIGDFLANIN